MKKLLLSAIVAATTLLVTGCGTNTTTNNYNTEHNTSVERDLRSIGSVNCLADEYGGSIHMNVLIKKVAVKKDNIKVLHQVDGANIGNIEKPIVATEGDNFNIISNVDVRYNKTSQVIEHKVLLIYFTGAVENIYTARCLQNGQSEGQ